MSSQKHVLCLSVVVTSASANSFPIASSTSSLAQVKSCSELQTYWPVWCLQFITLESCLKGSKQPSQLCLQLTVKKFVTHFSVLFSSLFTWFGISSTFFSFTHAACLRMPLSPGREHVSVADHLRPERGKT